MRVAVVPQPGGDLTANFIDETASGRSGTQRQARTRTRIQRIDQLGHIVYAVNAAAPDSIIGPLPIGRDKAYNQIRTWYRTGAA